MKNKGFTLIELLVVISIIGTLSSTVLAGLTQARIKGRIAAGIVFERNTYAALYDSRLGEYDFSDSTIGCWAENGDLLTVKDLADNTAALLKSDIYIALCTNVVTDSPLSLHETTGGLASINGQEQMAALWNPDPPTYGNGSKRQSIDIKFGGSSMFTDYITLPNNGSITGIGASFWIKCDTFTAGNPILSFSDGIDSYGVAFNSNGSTFDLTKGGSTVVTSISARSVCDSTWHHVFGSYSSVPKIYLDGHLAAVGSIMSFANLSRLNINLRKTDSDIYISHLVVYGNTVP